MTKSEALSEAKRLTLANLPEMCRHAIAHQNDKALPFDSVFLTLVNICAVYSEERSPIEVAYAVAHQSAMVYLAGSEPINFDSVFQQVKYGFHTSLNINDGKN